MSEYVLVNSRLYKGWCIFEITSPMFMKYVSGAYSDLNAAKVALHLLLKANRLILTFS